ncbi:MAG: TorD/DmsD family molecular chaperone [Bacteroidota bacterium]
MTEGRTGIDNNFFAAYNMLLSFAGSFILYEPEADCISELIKEDLLKRLPVESDNPKFIKAASYLRKINSDHPLDYEEIIKDHLELFGGKGKGLAPPYSSVYMSRDYILNNTISLEVRKIYHSYGWKSDFEGKVPDDHLGIEIQFISLLMQKYPELEDDICRKEISKDLIKFIGTYMKPWINEWNKHVQENARSDFYKGIGYLITSGLEDIYACLTVKD